MERVLKEVPYLVAGVAIGLTADTIFQNNPELSGELKLLLAREVNNALLGVPTEALSVAAGTIGWGVLRTPGILKNLLSSGKQQRHIPVSGEFLTFEEALAEEAHEYAQGELAKHEGEMTMDEYGDAYAQHVLDYYEEHDPNPPPYNGGH